MKLGISYNVFDGEELLEYSLLSVRTIAHHISVVYQTKSNYGNENPNLKKELETLQDKGLIDKLFLYEPKTFESETNDKHTIGSVARVICVDDKGKRTWRNGTLNEIEKREIGLKIAKANNCDTYMSMDADELYDTNEFMDALANFEIGDYDSSFCQMRTFYKFPTHQIDPPETYYVPMFYRIGKNSKMEFIHNNQFPVSCDPTRRMKAGYVKIFSRDEIEMYHYAYVRKNIESKIKNSSAQADKTIQERIIKQYNSFTKKDRDCMMLGQTHTQKVKVVENKFNIEI